MHFIFSNLRRVVSGWLWKRKRKRRKKKEEVSRLLLASDRDNGRSGNDTSEEKARVKEGRSLLVSFIDNQSTR